MQRRHNVFVLLVIQHEKRCEYVGNKREIFGQTSDLHQARMVREESERRKKHNRGMREIEREQKKKKKA